MKMTYVPLIILESSPLRAVFTNRSRGKDGVEREGVECYSISFPVGLVSYFLLLEKENKKDGIEFKS
jgi:hypothetical protein